MGWLVWFLFESVAALSAVLGVALFVLLVHWRRTGRGRSLLVGLGAAVVLLAVQALVVTQREHADHILRPIEKDLVASHTDALDAALAPDFESGNLDHDDFVTFVRRQFQRVKVRWLDRWALQVEEATADRFVVSASYTADVTGEGYVGTVQSTWSLTFVYTATGWKIGHIRPLHIAGLDNPAWENIDRHDGRHQRE
jgi:hypothetical protein